MRRPPRLLLSLPLVVVLTITATAQQPSDLAVRPNFTALFVSNLDSSIQWYSRHFELAVAGRVENSDRGFKQANLRNSSLWIELLELESLLSPAEVLKSMPRGTRLMGFFKVGFFVADFDRFRARLDSLGTPVVGQVVEDPISGLRTFLFRDPDGNLLQVFEESQEDR